MGWDELSGKAEGEAKAKAEAEHARREEESRELQRQVGAALQDPLLYRYFKNMALGQSYASGRSAEDVAHAEGRRAAAIDFLRIGGRLDG